MTELVTLDPGQWVLAFNQPYAPYDKPMPEHLEMFCSRGGGWDIHDKDEMFFIMQVDRVMPKTFTVDGSTRFIRKGQRLDRSCVIAALATPGDCLGLRERFFAIGAEADEQIDFAVDRLARPIRKRVYAQARKEVHSCLPHIFGRKV